MSRAERVAMKSVGKTGSVIDKRGVVVALQRHCAVAICANVPPIGMTVCVFHTNERERAVERKPRATRWFGKRKHRRGWAPVSS